MSREFAKMQIPGSSNWLGRSGVGPRNLSFNTILTQVVHRMCVRGGGQWPLRFSVVPGGCDGRGHLTRWEPVDHMISFLLAWTFSDSWSRRWRRENSHRALSTSAPPNTVPLYPYPSNFKAWLKIHSPSYLVLSLLILTVIPSSKGCGSNCHFHLLGPC